MFNSEFRRLISILFAALVASMLLHSEVQADRSCGFDGMTYCRHEIELCNKTQSNLNVAIVVPQRDNLFGGFRRHFVDGWFRIRRGSCLNLDRYARAAGYDYETHYLGFTTSEGPVRVRASYVTPIGTWYNSGTGLVKVEEVGGGVCLTSGNLNYEFKNWSSQDTCANKKGVWKLPLSLKLTAREGIRQEYKSQLDITGYELAGKSPGSNLSEGESASPEISVPRSGVEIPTLKPDYPLRDENMELLNVISQQAPASFDSINSNIRQTICGAPKGVFRNRFDSNEFGLSFKLPGTIEYFVQDTSYDLMIQGFDIEHIEKVRVNVLKTKSGFTPCGVIGIHCLESHPNCVYRIFFKGKKRERFSSDDVALIFAPNEKVNDILVDLLPFILK